MEKGLPPLGRAEWVLMEALWAAERATAGALQAQLQDDQGWAYSTVKTMLDRLVEKGYAQSTRTANVYEYTPKVRRTNAVTQVVDDVVDRVLEGSVSPFIHRLVEQKRLSSAEAADLRQLLDQYTDDEAPK